MSIRTRFHRVTKATPRKSANGSTHWVDIEDEGGNGVTIFFEGPEDAQTVARAISDAVSAKVEA